MPIAQAGEMVCVDGCQACIDQQDLHLDNEWLRQVANRFQQQISPLVAIEALDEKPWAGHPRHQPESLLCDITGVAHLFGGENGLIETAKALLSSLGLRGRMAIAHSVGAAWAVAHYGQEGSFTIDTLPDQLDPLPVEALRISPERVATLARLGVERVEQLLQLPRSGLASRLGADLVRRIEQVMGQADQPLEVYRAPLDHTATLALEYPTSDQKILADRIEKLAKKVGAGLATCQRGALRIACRLDLAAHPPLTLEIGLFAPTIDADHWCGLIVNQLETKKLPSCVDRITVSVTLSGPLRSSQVALFDGDFDQADACMSGSAISRLIDSLSGRLGRDAVVGVKIEDDPLPENAFRVSPLTGNHAASDRSFESLPVGPRNAAAGSPVSSPRSGFPHSRSGFPHSWSGFPHSWSGRRKHLAGRQADGVSSMPCPADAMRRPISLLPQPVPLAVAYETGPFLRSVSSPLLPKRMRLDGVIHQVVRSWGPERIETGWWKGPSIGRDYFRIETDRGRWWWIFRNLDAKRNASDTNFPCYRWMLHGWFN